MSEEVVERPSLIEHLEDLFPLVQLFIVVASVDLHSVKPVVLSPVWPRLEFPVKGVFHHLLKLVNAKCSGKEWYLGKAIFP